MTHYAPIPRSLAEIAHVSVTLKLVDAKDDLLVRHVRLLRDCVALAQQRWGFTIDAAVVLPSEMQLLCAFPDANFGVHGAINLITSAFSRHLPGEHYAGRRDALWLGSCEILEVSKAVVSYRRTFIEAAPVRAGLVKNARDWPYSSANNETAQASDMGVAVA